MMNNTTCRSRFIVTRNRNSPSIRHFSSFHGQSDDRSSHSSASTTISRIASTPSTPLVIPHDDEITKANKRRLLLPSSSTSTTTSKTTAYLDLAKAKLSTLVVATTAAGFVAAGGAPLSEQTLPLLTSCLVGTALCSSSAATWNQIFEIDRDARMKRTQQRPLVTGVLTKTQAQLAATGWGIAGTSILAFGTDPVTATLGLSNIVLYAGLYTYLKPRSITNTWVGAVVGAIPPVMGWTAATGGMLCDVPCWILGTTLYLWQLPHFFALSYMHRMDYKRGGFAMLPVVEEEEAIRAGKDPNQAGGVRTGRVILQYTAYLSTMPLIATATGVTSSMFALEGIVLNAYALNVAYQFQQDRTNAKARKVFLTSLWYLPCWLVLFLLHAKVWDEEKDEDVLRDVIASAVHSVRNQGRQICIHEQVIHKKKKQNMEGGTATENACPIVVGKKTSVELQASATTAVQEAQAKTALVAAAAANTSSPHP